MTRPRNRNNPQPIKEFIQVLNVLLFVFAFPLFGFINSKDVQAINTDENNKIDVCHRTNSSTNPYELIKIASDEDLIVHQNHSEDIIPAPVEGCPGEIQTPTVISQTDTPDFTITPDLSQTPDATSSMTIESTSTFTPTNSPAPTNSPLPEETRRPVRTKTPIPLPLPSQTYTSTPTATWTPSATSTPTASWTPSPISKFTASPTVIVSNYPTSTKQLLQITQEPNNHTPLAERDFTVNKAFNWLISNPFLLFLLVSIGAVIIIPETVRGVVHLIRRRRN